MDSHNTPKFTTLPTEVLQNIASQVLKLQNDRPNACQRLTSLTVFREYLWRSVTIEICEGSLGRFPSLPSSTSNKWPVDCTREVHFSSGFARNIKERCPHSHKHSGECIDTGKDIPDEDEDDTESDEEEDYEVHYECIDALDDGGCSVLYQLPKDTLRSLSWDTGTCIPKYIFGYDGAIVMCQSQLESLSITTDCTCEEIEYYPMGGLYELKSLKRLRWRAPRYSFVGDLTDMIYANADSLQHLEVDLVSWELVGHYRRLNPHQEGPGGLEDSLRFWRAPEGKISGPTLPALQTLCLTEVRLSKESVGVIDFSRLRTLKLRNCDKWDRFLEDAVQLCLPIGLKTLEIHTKCDRLTLIDGRSRDEILNADGVLLKFLAAFKGLEELYVGLEGTILFDKILPGVLAHRATLKRFVHDLRSIGGDPDPEHPLNADSSLDDDEAVRLLDNFQLEAMGLSLNPAQLIYLVDSSARSTSLKLLHLRQSRVDRGPHFSKFFGRVIEHEGSISDTSRDSDAGSSSDTGSSNETESSNDNGSDSYSLRPELRRFAEWAFGKDGIPSLKVIACGDYAYGGRRSRYKPVDVILCRPKAESEEGFRILDKFNDEVKEERAEIIDEYHDVLEACPVEPLLDWWM